ncbi:hypothetical protein PR001_g14452 [Phytophthora rubi]|uniref:Uncharacterized protein n=2 Tax=Phytophthora TaxID=4783 RepID=A0A6A3LGZ7_9STRA|nr:hypothetical protein PR001_g14452 [Phytophthora rubi]
MEEALVDYLEDNCRYTLTQMQEMLEYDFGVRISTSLIGKKLCDKRYTVKQVRIEPETCNNSVNIEKRRVFGEALLKHERKGSLIVYNDETNYSLYCKRTQVRAPIGQRAIVKLPPSKGANLQVQCAITPEVGLVHYATRRGSIKMQVNAEFVDAVYNAVKAHDVYRAHFTGCFSVLKARIKAFLALSHDQMINLPYGEKTERRMQLLEDAAEHCMPCIDMRLVIKMARHCALSVAAAIRGEPMEYGT